MPSYLHGTSTVTSSAAVISTSENHNNGLLVANSGPNTVYLGGSTVTANQASTGGIPLAPGERVTLPTHAGVAADLYAVTAAGSAYVSCLTIQ